MLVEVIAFTSNNKIVCYIFWKSTFMTKANFRFFTNNFSQKYSICVMLF